MNVFEHPEFDKHEQIVFCSDSESGLKAIIAIHNSNRGPAAGGCRMWPYENADAALTDVLRLSKGMSYKSALAGLDCGGGKSVIIADPHMPRAEKSRLLRAFARYVQSLGGRYYAAEDVGIGVDDVKVMMQESDYIFGLPDGSGDPSPFTARGVYEGMRAAVKFKLGRDDLQGMRVAVQGVGHVGYYLCEHLAKAGAELFISDIDQAALERASRDFGASIVRPEAIYGLDVDIYSPCALGATINDDTILKLNAEMVVGAANNQLQKPYHGDRLHEMGILYAPDYAVNAGGMINASGDIMGSYSRDWAMQKTLGIYDTLMEIFQESRRTNSPTYIIANQLAEARLSQELVR